MNIGANILESITVVFDTLGLNVNPLVTQIFASIIIFLIFIIIGWIVYHIFERYLSRWAKKTKTNLDDEILKNIKSPIYFFVILIGLFSAFDAIEYLDQYSDFIMFIFIIAEILLATYIVTRVVNVVIAWYAERRSKKKMPEMKK